MDSVQYYYILVWCSIFRNEIKTNKPIAQGRKNQKPLLSAAKTVDQRSLDAPHNYTQ